MLLVIFSLFLTVTCFLHPLVCEDTGSHVNLQRSCITHLPDKYSNSIFFLEEREEGREKKSLFNLKPDLQLWKSTQLRPQPTLDFSVKYYLFVLQVVQNK